ncbi:MAG: ribonucleotide-diphosphate reductase subunit beta, partial [Zymomonas sp.]|nr:ribonucleotide-diphosphate reductase subunit beta [Zymomonas sp.]
DVWDSFDKRQKVKAVPAANEDAGEGEGDMFTQAGIAAE